jgi:hypothetical protein
MLEGAVEVFLSYEVRNPCEMVYEESFIATSGQGLCGIYVPGPSEDVKRRKRDTDGGDEVELYGTVTGLNPGMKNWYKLKVLEGWNTLNAAPGTNVNSITVALMTVFSALILTL